MTKDEIETTINMTHTKKEAHIYTCDKMWIKRLKKLIEADPEHCKLILKDYGSDGYEAWFIEVPVSYIKVKIPRKGKALSQEEIQKLKETAKAAREAKAAQEAKKTE